MSELNALMRRGIVPPLLHGILDYPLALVLIVLPLVLSFDDTAAKWIAFAFGVGAAVLAVATAWLVVLMLRPRRPTPAGPVREDPLPEASEAPARGAIN